MPSEKTQELLDSLKEITQKPKKAEPVIRPASNVYGEDASGKPIFIDRIYGSVTGKYELVNKNGTIYKGKIHRKRRAIRSTLIGGTASSYYSICFETADGRWFDNCGMPIEAPKKVEEEEQVETVEVQKIELTPEEKLANEQAFLSQLK
jgi:hypothetical protein